MKFLAYGLLIVFALAPWVRVAPLATERKRPELDALLEKLRDESTSDEAKRALIQIVKSDPEAKAYVSERLPALLESYGGRGNRREDYTWGAAADLVAELRVAGAAPALCRKIDLVTTPEVGLSFFYNFVNRGATIALIRIGQPAVPCVADVLRHGTPLQRQEAAYVLGHIGTDDARHTLQEQLPAEKDPDVRRRIDEALKQQPWNPRHQ